MRASTFVELLHAGRAVLPVPGMPFPDRPHPGLARIGEFLGLVVDAAGVRRAFAELVAGAAPALPVQFEAWRLRTAIVGSRVRVVLLRLLDMVRARVAPLDGRPLI